MPDKPRRIPVTRDLLRKFPAPLWDRLDLRDCKAVMVIEGTLDGFRYFILDIDHSYGYGHRGATTTTFFVVEIPDSVQGRLVSWSPTGFEVSVGGLYVYLAKPGKKVRPGEWRESIEATIKTVECLKSPVRRKGVPRAKKSNSFSSVAELIPDSLRGFVTTGIALLLVAGGIATMVGWIDYRPECEYPESIRCITSTWRAWDAFKEGVKMFLAAGLYALAARQIRLRMQR